MREPVNERLPTREHVPGRPGRRAGLYMTVLILFVVGMFGFAYANAEFFVIVCQRVGLLPGSAADVRGEAPAGVVGDPTRPLEIYFSAHVNDGLPIAFTADRRFQKTHVGAITVNEYRFTNMSDRTIYFKPVHDVYPTQAGYPEIMLLTKCFCFDLQKIGPRESYTMPVEYLFTEDLSASTKVIRMSYSLFPSTKADYDKWMATAEEREKALETMSKDEVLEMILSQ